MFSGQMGEAAVAAYTRSRLAYILKRLYLDDSKQYESMVKTILIILNIAALLGALVWLYTDHSLEPLVTVIGLVAALIALLYNSDSGNLTIFKQKGGKNSTNYQAKGDITINN